MSRDYFQDVHPQQNKSIRNIPVDRPPREPVQPLRGYNAPPPERPVERPQRPQQPQMPPKRPQRSQKGWMRWVIALAAVVVLVVAVVFITWNTTVTVTPRAQTVVFDEQASFTAYPEGSAESTPGSLSYTVVERTLEETAVAEASGSEQVEEQASGTLTVYNEYSDDTLHLIKNTRFQTSDGRVYRVRESIDVPGKSGETPGKLNVTVYAEEPGERYNISGAAAFTLPGLKTSAPEMFEKVYARTETGMIGGFVGERPVVPEATLEAARITLQDRLQARARELVTTDIPEGSVAFPETLAISYQSLSPERRDDGSVAVREQALVRIPVFDTTTFARIVGAHTVADAENARVMIQDPSQMAARLVTESENLSTEPIDIAFSGRAVLVWQVDTAAFAQDLSGRDKEATQTVLTGYPGIVNAVVSLRPFWRTSFPEDPQRITIVVEEPEE